MKQLIEQSFKMGYEACPRLTVTPCLNKEFMATIPGCGFGDEKVCKLRRDMYKSYIKGWTKGHLDKIWNVE